MAEEKKFHRRSIRLRRADYSEAGAYFVTICAAGRRDIFGKIDDGRTTLSALGEIVRAFWVQIPAHFPVASLKEFVVMPNHLHGIIGLVVGARYIVPLDQRARTPEQFQKPVKGSIPTIVRTFKAAVTRRAKKGLGIGSDDVWQRNYFERVLRDGKSMRMRAGTFWRIRCGGSGTRRIGSGELSRVGCRWQDRGTMQRRGARCIVPLRESRAGLWKTWGLGDH
jgi:putative transposase